MATYAELQEQIKKLQADAEIVRKEEFSTAITQIEDLMSLHRITLEDLGDSIKKTSKTSQVKAKVKAKYREPATGNEWSGRGRQPKWVVDQLAAGRELDDFLIKD